jgi:hypothetical protein
MTSDVSLRAGARAALGAALLVAAAALVAAAPADAQRFSTRQAYHDRIHQGVERGTYRSFDEQLSAASRVARGSYVGHELGPGPDIARFKFLRQGGQMVWVDVDMRTARVVGMR